MSKADILWWGPSGMLRNYCYGIEFSSHLFLIDSTALMLQKVREMLDAGKSVTLLNTHLHHDHTADNQSLINSGVSYVSPLDVQDKQTIFTSNLQSLDVLKAPGHTDEHVIYLVTLDGVIQHVFVGDTIFDYGVGNCYSGNIEELFMTLQKIKGLLPDDCMLYFSHDYASTNLAFWQSMGDLQEVTLNEKRLYPHVSWKSGRHLNPFLLCDDKDEFCRLRLLRDKWN